MWLDESAFYLLPFTGRTYWPRGQTPVLKAPCSYDHLSAISAITPSGHLYFEMKATSYKSEDVVAFLKKLRRQIGKKLLIIWDGAPIHQAQAIRDYLAGGATRYIQLEKLPGYAPDLNPDEGIWGYLKRVELKNVCCADLNELIYQLKRRVMKLRRKPHIIRACVAQAGLTL